MTYKLPYVKEVVTDYTTDYGFNEVVGIEHYNEAILRDKVIFRIDLLYSLVDCFSEDILCKYRQLIYNIVSGNNRDKVFIAKIFKALYIEDIKFREFLGEKIYFDESLKVNSLYNVILTSIHEVLYKNKTYLIEELRKKNIRFIVDSHCYMYVSIPDNNIVVSIPAGFREEVVSHAKVWKGNFSKYYLNPLNSDFIHKVYECLMK